jgi:RNA polymerase sigma factor (sigma-70 family)
MYNILLGSLFIITGIVFFRLCSSGAVFKKSLSAPPYAVFSISSSLMIAAKTLEWLVPAVSHNVILFSLYLIGMLFAATAWFGICFGLMVKGKQPRLPVILSLFILPLLLSVLIVTNGAHSLLWGNGFSGGIRILAGDAATPGFYVVPGYALGAAYAGLFIFAGTLRKQSLFSFREILLPAGAFMIPLLVYGAGVLTGAAVRFMDILFLHFGLLILLFFYYLYYSSPLGESIAHQNFLSEFQFPVTVINRKRRIIYVNPKMRSLLGGRFFQIIGREFKTVFPALGNLSGALTRLSFYREVVFFRDVIYDLHILPVHDWLGRKTRQILMFYDISQLKVTEKNLKRIRKQIEQEVVSRVRELKSMNEVLKESNQALIDEIAQRRKAERMINTALDEKNILIGEIHHRVKNNLQIIISLLNLQKRYFDDERIREVFRTTINRIRSIGMIHEKLYKAQDLANTNIAEYIDDLSHYLFHSFADKGNNILLRVDVEKIYLDLNRSILCGLIINELVSNSMKHAFDKAAGGKTDTQNQILIRLFTQGEELVLVVRDNGKGMPQDIDINTVESLGMKIITTLVKQLKGRIEFKNEKGTEVKISFAREQPFSNVHTEQQEMLQRIQDALTELPRKVRETTILYYLDGKSINEVSQALGISVENVQSQLQTARKQLKDLLTKSVS